MPKSKLDSLFREIMEKGFDKSFAGFCARTVSSYSYTPDNLARALMHAYYLRLFLQEYMLDPYPERRDEDFMRVGLQAAQELEKAERPTGMDFCRAFVEKWCQFLAR